MSGLDPTTSLAIAELAIYILIVPIVVYIFIRHGKPGYLGWGFLLVFCGLRLTADGFQINDHSKASKGEPVSGTGSIINSVGISGLLLSLSGIISEAYHRTPNFSGKINLVIHLVVHIFVTGGIVIAAIGGSNLYKPESASNSHSTDNALREVGAIILFLVVIGLCLFTYFMYNRLRSARSQVHANALNLLYFTVPALLFTLIRAAYTLVYSFDHSPSVSPVTGTFAVKFVLIFLVQLLAVLCLIAGGLVTRFIRDEDREKTKHSGSFARDVEGMRKHGSGGGLVLGEYGAVPQQ